MGRPTNKRLFGGGAGDQIGCNGDIGAGDELCFIQSQRSNSTYVISSEAGGLGTPTRTGSATLVQGPPTAEGEMQVEVQAENAVTPRPATVTYTLSGDALDTVTIADAGYGYWANDTGVAVADGTGGTVDITVANGSVVSVGNITGGSGYAGTGPSELGAEAANPPLQSARIINARTVKTFEGNTFLWPIVGTNDGAGPSGRGEADLQYTTL